MDGVTVLQTIPAFAENVPFWICIIVMLIGIGTLVFSYCICNKHYALSIFLMAIGILTIYTGIRIPMVKHPEQYKITVDDSVSYNKLCTKYKVIGREGKILTVQLMEE